MLEYYQLLDESPSFRDSLKALEADIQHANILWDSSLYYSFLTLAYGWGCEFGLLMTF